MKRILRSAWRVELIQEGQQDRQEGLTQPLLELEMEDAPDLDHSEGVESSGSEPFEITIPEFKQEMTLEEASGEERGANKSSVDTDPSKTKFHRRTMSSDYAWVLQQLRSDGLLHKGNTAPSPPSTDQRQFHVSVERDAAQRAPFPSESTLSNSSANSQDSSSNQSVKLEFEDLVVTL